MGSLADILRNAQPEPMNGEWISHAVDPDVWTDIAKFIAAGDADLTALWGYERCVRMAFMERTTTQYAIVSLDCPDRKFPSVALHHVPAQRLERTILDVYGLEAIGAQDRRPWLDHGTWKASSPGGDAAPAAALPPYEFLTAGGAPLHQIPVGPVHAGIIEPGHFRFTANGETVVRLEERLGYVHKGVEMLMRRKPLAQAAKVAARISGDSTVASSFAFARAIESACNAQAPPRAQILRGIMAEMERLANHFGDIGSICNDASFSIMQAHCHVLRERVLRASEQCFGHRLMMDRIVPGGLTVDLPQAGVDELHRLFGEIDREFPHLVDVYDTASSMQDRTVRTGIVSRNLVEQFAAGGVVGRASGRAFDARKSPGYAPYPDVFGNPVIRSAGDVDARVWVRIDEIARSMDMIRKWLETLPDGHVLESLNLSSHAGREGASLVEAFRGDLFCWIRLGTDGAVEHCHIRDASWFQWPLLEAAIEGNIVADFPLCNKSFNCSYSGHDL